MADFDLTSCSELCTYAIGKTNSIQQAIYTCETCAGESNVCCCAGCAETCHKDHEVNFVAFGESYCDCGHGGCNLVQQSQNTALKLLGDRTITFDKCGRVGGAEVNDHYSVPSFAANEVVGLDFESASTLRDECINLVTHSKETFWLGMNDQPRCMLEETASLIFQHHIANYVGCASLDAGNTGAEWWTQVKYFDEPVPSSDDMSNSDDDNVDTAKMSSSGVDLHYDKDEEVASLFGVGIFPHISTVTYLTDNRHFNSTATTTPTVVFETTASQPVGSGIKKCFVSLAEVGKHVSFDGRFLHGAPSQLSSFARNNYNGESSSNNISSDKSNIISNNNNKVTPTRAVRVTFLVNVWVNHHPAAIAPLPLDIVNTLNSTHNTGTRLRPLQQLSITSSITTNTTTYPVSSLDVTAALTEEDGDGSDLGEWLRVPFVSKQTEWGKGDDEAGLALVVWMPYSVKSVRTWQSTHNTSSSKSSGNKKKKTKLTHNTVSAESNKSTSGLDSPLSNTFQLVFRDKNSHSRLEYEEDSPRRTSRGSSTMPCDNFMKTLFVGCD